MKQIILYRIEDETGISGIGRVAVGLEFDDGKCVIQWQTTHRSICIYDSIADVIAIHSHGGKTKIMTNTMDAMQWQLMPHEI